MICFQKSIIKLEGFIWKYLVEYIWHEGGIKMADGKIRTEIILERMIQETSEIFSFVFKIPGDLTWIPGQHGIFRYRDRQVEEDKGFRIFSIASIIDEGIMMFSTRITPESTDFKQQLLTMKQGEVMTVEGINGKFKIPDYNKKACIMAGGIGVTPIRALVKQMESEGISPAGVTVLYSDDRGQFAYEEDLRKAGEAVNGLEVILISDRNIFVQKIEEYTKNNGNESAYLISGTPGMNAFITEKLTKEGIEKTNIITDVFMGYE
jgi:ferredoxin-NADP reductase